MEAQTWLWHEECRQGKVFCKSEEAALLQADWVDDPCKLSELPASEAPKEITPPALTGDAIKDAMHTLKAAGYLVLTPIELEAEINKAKAPSMTHDHETPPQDTEVEPPATATNEVTNEVTKPENTEVSQTTEPDDINERLEAYKDSPQLLTDEELLVLAKDLQLDVRSNMLRATIETKINDHIADAE